eukprot:2298081-Pleurochrysis_carterae.AAC.1
MSYNVLSIGKVTRPSLSSGIAKRKKENGAKRKYEIHLKSEFSEIVAGQRILTEHPLAFAELGLE